MRITVTLTHGQAFEAKMALTDRVHELRRRLENMTDKEARSNAERSLEDARAALKVLGWDCE